MDGVDLQKVLQDPKERVRFMIQRHQSGLLQYDQQMADLQGALELAIELGDAPDVKFYMAEKRKLLKERCEYDFKMSGEIELWRNFAEQERTETAVIFHLEGS